MAETTRVLTDDCTDGRVGRRVLVVGDSIIAPSQATLERVLGRAGWSVCLRVHHPTELGGRRRSALIAASLARLVR